MNFVKATIFVMLMCLLGIIPASAVLFHGSGSPASAPPPPIPVVSNITTTPSNAFLNLGKSVSYTIIFSSPVIVAGGTPSLLLNCTGCSATYTSGSGSANLVFNYTVGNGQNSANLLPASSGAIVLAGATIKDGSGNNAILTGADGFDPAGTIVVDTIAPTVSGVQVSGPGVVNGTGTVGTGAVVTFTVTMSEVVNVVGSPSLSLNNNGTASYAGGSGTQQLLFNYTVVSGQNTPDLAVTAFNYNSSTLRDPAGNDAFMGTAGSVAIAYGPRVPVGPQSSITCPVGAVSISPGTTIQTVVNAHGAGTSYCLTAGTFTNQSVTPKNGDIYTAQFGTTMDGGGGTAQAFTGSASGVTVQNIVITNYQPGVQHAIIDKSDGTGVDGWTLKNLEVKNGVGSAMSAGCSSCGGTGISFRNGSTIVANYIHDHPSLGFSCYGPNDVITDNEIARNNPWSAGTQPQVDPGWEAGGNKCWGSNGENISYNYSHDNGGPGLWFDSPGSGTWNTNATVTYNRVTGNYYNGIMWEVSKNAVIAFNSTSNNGGAVGTAWTRTGSISCATNWLWCAEILLSSSSALDAGTVLDVHDNVLVASSNGAGITSVSQGRGDSPGDARNLHVHHNTVTLTGNASYGLDSDFAGAYSDNNTFNNDLFSGGQSNFFWNGGGKSLATFRSNGLEGTIGPGAATTTGGGGGTGVIGNPPGTLVVNTGGAGAYVTNFPSTENPISQSSIWTNGSAAGAGLWGDVQTVGGNPGIASGASLPQNNGNPTAVLTGFSWQANQSVQGTVRAANPPNTCCTDVELRLNTTITPNSITGYQVACEVNSSYFVVQRWNGAIGNTTQLATATGSTGCRDGDVLTFQNQNGVLTVSQNGTQVASVSDTTYTNGSPGLGFWNNQVGSSPWTNTGFSQFCSPSTQCANAPTIVSVVPTPSSGTLTSGNVNIALGFSLPVTVALGTPTIPLNNGATATYTTGSGTSTLNFNYPVGPGQNATPLATTGSGIVLSGATIRDNGGNNAVLTGAQTISFTGLNINTGTVPSVSAMAITGTGISGGSGTIGAGALVTITDTFTAPVTVAGGTPTLSLNSGGTASYVSGSGTTNLAFNYTVLAGQNSSDLAITSFNLNGATLKDSNGNNANTAGAVGNPPGTLVVNTGGACSGTQYYVSNAGSDGANGTSSGSAWQNISRVNTGPTGKFQAGDCVNFRGGDTFTGCLYLAGGVNFATGVANNPAIVQSYGTGNATIVGTSACGFTGGTSNNKWGVVMIDGNSAPLIGLKVQNLTIRPGSGVYGDGIVLEAQNAPVSYVTITNNDVGGFNTPDYNTYDAAEILITSQGNEPGYGSGCQAVSNITVTNNTVHGLSGLTSPDSNGIQLDGTSYNGTACIVTNLLISGNEIFNIGSPGHDTGAGVILGNNWGAGGSISPSNVVVANNRIHDIAGNNFEGGGGMSGVETSAVNGCTIRNNEIYLVHAAVYDSGDDGDGVDLDAGTSNCIVEYNYTHDNFGNGIYGFISSGNGGGGAPNGQPWQNNTFRYNVSVNDARTTSHNQTSMGMSFNGGDHSVTNIQWYNNTVFTNVSGGHGWGIAGGVTMTPTGIIKNNIIYAGGSASRTYCNVYFGAVGDFSGFSMSNNGFAGNGSGTDWAGCSGYSAAGTTADPSFVGPMPSGNLSWTPSTTNGPLPGPNAAKLNAGSSYIGAGTNITGNGGSTFFGTTITSPPSIGAQ